MDIHHHGIRFDVVYVFELEPVLSWYLLTGVSDGEIEPHDNRALNRDDELGLLPWLLHTGVNVAGALNL